MDWWLLLLAGVAVGGVALGVLMNRRGVPTFTGWWLRRREQRKGGGGR